MKIKMRLAALFAAALLVTSFTSCDDNDWKDDFADVQEELDAAKQELANQKQLIAALQSNASITGIENGKDRYVIQFSDGHSITLTNGMTPLITVGANGNWLIDGTDTGIGAKATDGVTPKVEIGENGNWVVNGQDTGLKAKGEAGVVPEVGIGANGNWFVDGKDTGVSAKGEAGNDGQNGVDGKTPVVEIGANKNWFINGEDTGIKAEGVDCKEGLYITSIVDTETNTDFIFSDGSVNSVAKVDVNVIQVKGKWCSLGTSITWWDAHVEEEAAGRFTKGYQTRVRERLHFDDFVNQGVSGSTILDLKEEALLHHIEKADYYTIEHGINDWGQFTELGTFEDFKSGSTKSNFYSAYAVVLKEIYSLNPDAKVILCTPRKAYGFGGYLPNHWYDANIKGQYLKEYSDAIREIAEYMSLPVADFFNDGQANQMNLPSLSIDEALHPNDPGHQIMANIIVEQFLKIINLK